MRVKRVTIAVLAALCLFQAALANDDKEAGDAAENDGGDDDDGTTVDPPTTPTPPVFEVELVHVRSFINAISVSWATHKSFNDDVKRYYATATKVGSLNVLTSPDITSDIRQFEFEDLVHESDYMICLYCEMENGTLIEDCEQLDTIAFIRDDSLIILFCVLGYIGLMILLGYFCWSYAKKKAEEEAMEEEEEEKEGNEALLGR